MYEREVLDELRNIVTHLQIMGTRDADARDSMRAAVAELRADFRALTDEMRTRRNSPLGVPQGRLVAMLAGAVVISSLGSKALELLYVLVMGGHHV